MAYALDFQRVWINTNTNYCYVDSWGGDDLTGNGTSQKPFASINKANSTMVSEIVCRGVFSEQVSSIKRFIADRFGEALYDGKGQYTIVGGILGSNVNVEKNGLIYLNSLASSGIAYGAIHGSVVINVVVANILDAATMDIHKFSVIRAVKMVNQNEVAVQVNGVINNLYLDMPNAVRRNLATMVVSRCLYDNCRIYLDVNATLAASSKMDTCLFRASCTFWARSADGSADIRIDADGQTAAQKYAAVQSWFSNGAAATGYSKLPWVACQITDNRIVNAPDGVTDGYALDYSLIYGTKEAQPACWMDGGKHIGPFPPAVKIDFKETANLTASPYEVEVRPTDKLTIANGRVSLNPDFSGAVLYSKAMPMPGNYVNFNGVNVPFVCNSGTRGVFLTPAELLSLEEAAKVAVTVGGVALENNKVYVVKCDDGTYVSYRGFVYTQGTVITGYDNTSQATLGGAGAAYLYPIRRPVVFSTVQVKVWENGSLPADFLTNDAAYPYLTSPAMSTPGDKAMETGLRCLRVGNIPAGAIDVGTDGRPLTNAHPEYYSAANTGRLKFPIRASWVALKITINSIFNQQ
ncbi:hypothetical protein [Williamwhitmania taraxaci]|uniref:Uncharacterized protein n=1 Tax=Williamwhitmania taraxaci TaxID=1640674 RepID=A0A1G6M934_9BACT|nr:hypothetical protein [Williamwhitmania taraxaci]SDC52102.1 hypothetical protein SAMN05216323_10357 [Williamwhitmania taraxaci]